MAQRASCSFIFPILFKTFLHYPWNSIVSYKLLYIFSVTPIYIKNYCMFHKAFLHLFETSLQNLWKLHCKIFKILICKIIKTLVCKVLRNSSWKRGWLWDCLASGGFPHSGMCPCSYGAVCHSQTSNNFEIQKTMVRQLCNVAYIKHRLLSNGGHSVPCLNGFENYI